MIAALTLVAALGFAPSVHHAVSTTDARAQAAFDRGLRLLYAYNGEAASRAFAQALQDDPHLAMAAWGEALAAGSDLNTPLDASRLARAHDAALRAQALETFASPQERLYVDAVVQRYGGTYERRDAGDARYRGAMAALVAAYPLDDDAATLDAEALLEHSGVEHADPQAIALIARVLARDSNHLFANHLCIHAYDFAANRAPAVVCADRMAAWTFTPPEEHLAHMPAHTYTEVGDYAKALAASETAWRLREEWNAQANPPFKLRYGAHDAYTGWTNALMLGDLQVAQTWAARVGREYEGSDLWATWARFGRWQWIASSTATNEFYAPLARGLTDVHLGAVEDARKMLALYGNIDADYRWLLTAAIDEHDGNIASAVAALDRAIAYQQREDGAEQLPVFPAGEALGALYYRQKNYEKAQDAFTQTLARYPNDPRALYGLALAQRALGQAVSSAQTLKTFTTIWTEPTPPDLADL
ncbi:MAG TPA: tetratricopeptide repeat protein [Candidatus Baltobacteraceae bacterium]|nr:tetratricopeptide repeat protein [Candidatus Baltobacteraceae bacterium]